MIPVSDYETFPDPPVRRLRDLILGGLLGVVAIAAVALVGTLLVRIVVYIVLTLAGLR